MKIGHNCPLRERVECVAVADQQRSATCDKVACVTVTGTDNCSTASQWACCCQVAPAVTQTPCAFCRRTGKTVGTHA